MWYPEWWRPMWTGTAVTDTGAWAMPMWGFWLIFPLLGMFICLAFAVMAFRFLSTGRGFMCMGGHQRTESDETAEMRREIRTLREELNQLKTAR